VTEELPEIPDVPLRDDADDFFPTHVYEALGIDPRGYAERIGGAVMVVAKQPEGGPLVMMTSGVSRLPTESGERVELAVEVSEDQQGAGWVALEIVCNDIAMNRRVPPVGVPWVNSEPIFTDTAITAIMVTESRWGAEFDEVRGEHGEIVGHVRTLRLLTGAEAELAAAEGFAAVVDQAGSLDALIDVERGK